MTQYYEAEVVSEYLIRGNAAILKCTIPSFVAEFVSVDTWEGSDGTSYRMSHDYGIHTPRTSQRDPTALDDPLFSLNISFKAIYTSPTSLLYGGSRDDARSFFITARGRERAPRLSSRTVAIYVYKSVYLYVMKFA